MFTGALAAWRAASPLIKYGAIAGAMLAGYLWYIGQREYHEWQGRLQAEAVQERELRKQAQASAEESAKQYRMLQQKVEEVAQEKESFRTELAKANQEIRRYEKLQNIRKIDADAIRIVNEFASVLNDTTPDERVSDSSGAASEPPVETKTGPTTLDAFERLSTLTERLALCEADHRGLSEWAIAQYQSSLMFHNVQQDQRGEP